MANNTNAMLNALYLKLFDGQAPDPDALQDILNRLRSNQVVIYGAGRTGRLLKQLLASQGIRLSAFVDRNQKNIHDIDGVAVYPPEWLFTVDARQDTSIILGAGTLQLAEMIAEDLKRIDPDLSADAVNGVFLVYLLQYQQCNGHSQQGEYVPLKHCISYHVKPYKCPVFCRHVEELAQQANPADMTVGSSLNDVGYLLGEVCTLRCEHCLESVPYLSNPTRLSKGTVIRDIRKLVNSCRFLHRLDLVGGEPFAHPELIDIIREVVAIPKIGYIGVFTNGTVVPGDDLCEVLRDDRIIVTVSDYSDRNNLTENQTARIRRTIDMLDAHRVNFVVYADRYWVDINDYSKGNVSEQKLKDNFAHCFLAACHRIYDGTLYHCPYQASGIKLGKIEKRDCVDIHQLTPEQLTVALDNFERAAFIDACRYCNLPKGPREVPAGRQLTHRTVSAVSHHV